MPRLSIDRRKVEVPEGATVLDAARKLGIEIPTLCYLKDYEPSTSCLVCMVKIVNANRLAPSCATAAVDGMEIESETEEVHDVRRSALELLLSDHLGDCLAPCYFACPAHMDVPKMLRQIATGENREAIVTIKEAIALPAVLGRICPAPCEKTCRRKDIDAAVDICRLKRFAADVDISSENRYLPAVKPSSGKRVTIIGAGPAGLAAAYHLAQRGHACTILDEKEKPGGRLFSETNEDELPRDVIDADVEPIRRLGVDIQTGTRVEAGAELDDLIANYDAVLIACGATGKEQADGWGLKAAARGIQVDKATYQTGRPGVFAAGNALRTKGLVIRSVADGKEAAAAINRHLAGNEPTGKPKPFNVRIGRMEPDELKQLAAGVSSSARQNPAGGPHAGFDAQEAARQAARCLHCDCRGLNTCKLREHAATYNADPRRYTAPRKTFQQDLQHAEVVYEPGKCIACGLCIEIAKAADEPLGLTFIGRGFDVRVGVPLHGRLEDALKKVAADCVEACPTAALSQKAATGGRAPTTATAPTV